VASVAVAGGADRVGRALARTFAAGVVVAALVAVVGLVTIETAEVEAVLTEEATAEPRLVEVAGVAGILVHAGGRTRVLLPRDPKGDPVAYCRKSRTFVSQLYGSSFALDGTKLGGPAPRGLDEYRVHERRDGRLVVETDHIVKGEGHAYPVSHSVAWHENLTIAPDWCP
jgi:hypothetical protein